jgi:acyl-CoA thioesterase
MHPFDESIALEPAGEHRWRGATHAGYANMVGPFGGTLAAVLLNGALGHPQRLGDPIALTVNFAGPVADGAFEIEALPMRTNRSTQHWNLVLRQGGEAAVTGSAVFATRRDTWSAHEAAPPAGMPPAAALQRMPTAGIAPWVARYDMRFEGGVPFRLDGEEAEHSLTRAWVRDDPARPLDFASLAAICDSFFPRLFVRRNRRSAIGTISLSSYFHVDAAGVAAQGERHLLGTAQALRFHAGYFDQSAQVWGDDGQLLASTHQMVYYRA